MAGYGDRIRTVEGINFSMVGLLMALSGSIVGAVGTWLSVATATSPDPFNPLGGFGAGFALILVAGLLSFLAMIIYLVGFSHIYSGRFEFGQEHEKWVSRGLWALVMTIILAIVSFGVSTVLSFMLVAGSFSGQPPDPGTVASVFLVSAVLGALSQLCMALTILFPVRTLAKPEHTPLLGLVTLIFVLGPVVGGAVNLVTFDPSLGGIGGFVSVGAGIGTVIAGVMFSLALGVSLLFYMMMKKRITSGEVQVQMRPMAVLPYYPMIQPYPMYPSYPPQYAAYPPQYPSYPPPQYPSYPPPQYAPAYPQQFPPPPAAVTPVPVQVVPVPVTPAEPAKPEEPKEKKPPEPAA